MGTLSGERYQYPGSSGPLTNTGYQSPPPGSNYGYPGTNSPVGKIDAKIPWSGENDALPKSPNQPPSLNWNAQPSTEAWNKPISGQASTVSQQPINNTQPVNTQQPVPDMNVSPRQDLQNPNNNQWGNPTFTPQPNQPVFNVGSTTRQPAQSTISNVQTPAIKPAQNDSRATTVQAQQQPVVVTVTPQSGVRSEDNGGLVVPERQQPISTPSSVKPPTEAPQSGVKAEYNKGQVVPGKEQPISTSAPEVTTGESEDDYWDQWGQSGNWSGYNNYNYGDEDKSWEEWEKQNNWEDDWEEGEDEEKGWWGEDSEDEDMNALKTWNKEDKPSQGSQNGEDHTVWSDLSCWLFCIMVYKPWYFQYA